MSLGEDHTQKPKGVQQDAFWAAAQAKKFSREDRGGRRNQPVFLRRLRGLRAAS